MQPDPELERDWQGRAQHLFAAAPDPDSERLAASLNRVHERARRSRRRRTRGLLAAAALVTAASAAAAWWIVRAPAPDYKGQQPGHEAEAVLRSADEPADSGEGRGDNNRRERDDGPVIYRRAQ